jgi:hypothetical protein
LYLLLSATYQQKTSRATLKLCIRAWSDKKSTNIFISTTILNIINPSVTYLQQHFGD